MTWWEYGVQSRYPMEPLTRAREDGKVEQVWLDGTETDQDLIDLP